jgi:hypothetical protein
MTPRYVEIRYTDSVERVPLNDLSELKQILADRGSFVSYSIHSHWWYGLAPHGNGKTVYDPQVSPRGEERH